MPRPTRCRRGGGGRQRRAWPVASAAHDDVQRRRETGAHWGQLSAASVALTAMPMAPASLETLAALRDPERRPLTPGAAAAGSLPHDPLALTSHAQWTQGDRSWSVRMYSGTPPGARGRRSQRRLVAPGVNQTQAETMKAKNKLKQSEDALFCWNEAN